MKKSKISEYKAKTVEEKSRIQLETYFTKLLIKAGFNFASGVPCGVQKYIISTLSSHPNVLHIPATREAEAIGIAAGAALAGKKPLIYMQNSGLMDSLNEITSLLIPYEIPVLFLITWRGAPGEDAPQHLINGRSLIKILDTIGMPAQILTKQNMEETVALCEKWIKLYKKPIAILLIRGVLK